MSSSIDSINQTTTASTATSSNDALMGKQDFLMLLVAQLQNQDPLNPSDPTEFTAQLAQFSSLEQLFTLNESMENLVTSNANADRFSTLNTIGKDVAYHSSSFNFTGEAVEIGYQLDGEASEVTLSLQRNGVTIATIEGEELSSGSHYFTWDGVLENGQVAPAGKYEITIQAKSLSEESVGVAPLIKSEVTGVDLNGEYGGVLITKAGEVAFSSILGVYDPETSTPATETEE
jgi:flagellar basal-body rod modification protein FlgD